MRAWSRRARRSLGAWRWGPLCRGWLPVPSHHRTRPFPSSGHRPMSMSMSVLVPMPGGIGHRENAACGQIRTGGVLRSVPQQGLVKGAHMIEIDDLTKRYGDKTAVDRLGFMVEPGVVTGFLGPNGAGKSTTMRVIAGLDRPTSGTVRVNGKHYPEAAAPLSERRRPGARRHQPPRPPVRRHPAGRTTQQPARRPDTAGPHQPRARRLLLYRRRPVQRRDRGQLVPVGGHGENPCRRILSKLGLRDRRTGRPLR